MAKTKNLEDDKQNVIEHVEQEEKTNLYYRDVDYVYSVEENEYYINYPTLVQIAIKSDNECAKIYVKKSWELIEFITNVGKESHNNFKNQITMSIEQRKKMFDFYEKLW